MPIRRISEQTRGTLEEFYRNASNEDPSIDTGSGMLQLIDWINQQFRVSNIWALTSLNRLVLLNENNWQSRWYVIIYNWSGSYFAFEYLLPLSKQPWPDAMVRGETNSFDEATKYLLISMDESGGWNENEELKQLLASRK
jgi:hypothetical protein